MMERDAAVREPGAMLQLLLLVTTLAAPLMAGLFAEIFRTQATTVSAQQRTALTDLALRGNPGNPELLTLRSQPGAGTVPAQRGSLGKHD